MTIGLKSALHVLNTVLGIGESVDKGTIQADANLVASHGSITEFLGELIVEPTFIVSESVVDSAAYADVIGLEMNMFATLYANALTKLVDIDGHSLTNALSVLSSKGRSLGSGKQWNARLGLESEIPDSELDALADHMFTTTVLPAGEAGRVDDRSGKWDKSPSLISKELLLKITVDGKEVHVPITIRSEVIVASTTQIKDYVGLYSNAHTFFARRHKLKSGAISYSEFVFCTDILKEYGKKLKQGSKDNIIERLEDRKRKALGSNQIAPMGLSRDYGALIISNTDKQLVEAAIRGKLTDDDDKDKLLSRIASFNIVVVNEGWQSIQLHISNVKGSGGLIPFDKLKDKDDKNKLESLFEAITGGNKVRL